MPKPQAQPLQDLRPLIIRLRTGEAMNCAVGDIEAMAAEMLLSLNRQPVALMKELKTAYPKVVKPAHGTASIPEQSPKEVHLHLAMKPASGITRRLASRLKVHGIRKVVISTDKEQPWEIHESEDKEAVASAAHRGGPRVRVASRNPTLPSDTAMATDRLVSAAAYGDSYDKPISGVLHHHRGHDR